MRIQPHGGRVDANQAQIVRELRSLGFRVDNVSQLKKLYDLVVTGKVFGDADDIRSVRVEVKQQGENLSPAIPQAQSSASHCFWSYPSTPNFNEATKSGSSNSEMVESVFGARAICWALVML